MISINFVPEHLHKKDQRPSEFWLTEARIKKWILAMILILTTIHGILQFTIFQIHRKIKGLQAEELRFQPQKQQQEQLASDQQQLERQWEDFQALNQGPLISWSMTLDVISDPLPDGVWLESLDFKKGSFKLVGFAVGREGEEMQEVQNFFTRLKTSSYFVQNFEPIELEMIKRSQVNHTPVAEFMISAQLRHPDEKK